MQTAKLEYEVKGESPYSHLSDIISGIGIDNTGTVVGNRPQMSVYFNKQRAMELYMKSATAHRDGIKNMKTIEFPLRMGNITFVKAMPASNLITLLFRHDSITASAYDDEGDEYDTFYQPYFYFVINIDTSSGNKRYTTIQPLHSVDGRAFPHNSGASSSVYTTNCDGGYGSTLNEALNHDNLGIFLGQMNHLIANGTNHDDEYGNSHRSFVDNVRSQDVHIRVDDVLEAQIIAISNSDPEGAPFNHDDTNQVRTFTFKNPAVEHVYMQTMCESINQNEVTT